MPPPHQCLKNDNFYTFVTHFLDFAKISAPIVFVSTLGISQRDRLASRVAFYLLVGLAFWTTHRLVPDPAVAEAAKWEALGVAQPYIAVPYEEVERRLFRASR